jgi:hypothetical protein
MNKVVNTVVSYLHHVTVNLLNNLKSQGFPPTSAPKLKFFFAVESSPPHDVGVSSPSSITDPTAEQHQHLIVRVLVSNPPLLR